MLLLFRSLAANQRKLSYRSSWGGGYPATRIFSSQDHQDPRRNALTREQGHSSHTNPTLPAYFPVSLLQLIAHTFKDDLFL